MPVPTQSLNNNYCIPMNFLLACLIWERMDQTGIRKWQMIIILTLDSCKNYQKCPVWNYARGAWGNTTITKPWVFTIFAAINSSRNRPVIDSPLYCLQTFFIRCSSEEVSTFRCRVDFNCEVTGSRRSKCKYCRYRKCIAVGMARRGNCSNLSSPRISPLIDCQFFLQIFINN